MFMAILIKFILVFFICLPQMAFAADTDSTPSVSEVQQLIDDADPGDTITFQGDATWSSYVTIDKELIIDGNGHTITVGGSNSILHFGHAADGFRLTGLTIDMDNWSSGEGAVRLGYHNTDTCRYPEIYHLDGYRIDHNTFLNSPYRQNGEAIWSKGLAYGLIDNNTFTNHLSENMIISGCGPYAATVITDFGMYEEGVTYIEDNTFSINGQAANTIDGNDGAAWVFRHNTINIPSGGFYSKAVEAHGFCVNNACPNTLSAGVLRMEVYNNTVNVTGSGSFTNLVKLRGGDALVYDNIINGSSEEVLLLSNYRSLVYDCEAVLSSGYSNWCHESAGAYTVEGRSFDKTTLGGALGDDTGCPTMASVTDFPTYGGSIIVDNEQIDYTAISTATLTPCTRGANGTSRASHSNGADVDLLIYGSCVGQTNNTYVWGNTNNNVKVETSGWTEYDIQSYTERPENWQYRADDTEYSYTPYTYPHPLRDDIVISNPQPDSALVCE